MNNLYRGDCLEVMRTLPDGCVDAIVTDPPYGLSFMGKKWDYDVPSVEVWSECLRVLKPGGHLLAFAGTRTQHRMAVRIEDAGFDIRDMIAWVYGSGFPKSLDVSKAIDKAAGNGVKGEGSFFTLSGGKSNGGSKFRSDHPEYEPYKPATDAARQWQGWGTALKPALEPITVARKPLVGTVAANVLAHGTGALNIDGCRVGDEVLPAMTAGQAKIGTFERGVMVTPERIGRWPANLIHDGSDEVLQAFPQAPGQMARARDDGTQSSNEVYGKLRNVTSKPEPRGDTGSAARFFYCAKASKADRDEGLEGFVKTSGGMVSNTSGQHMTRRDEGYEVAPRANNHPTVKPTDLMRYLCRLITPPGGVVLDPFMGSGSTGKAAMLEGFGFIGIEREEPYFRIAKSRIEAAIPVPEWLK